MLAKRQKELLLILINRKEILPGKALAELLEVSVKTIQRDVNEINAEIKESGIEIASIKGSGYSIDDSARQTLMDHYFYNSAFDKHIIPDTKEGRISWLIRYIVNNTLYEKRSTVSELSHAMFVSEGSIQRYLADIRKLVAEYDLLLSNDSDGLTLIGNEVNLRRVINEFLIDDVSLMTATRIYQMNPARSECIEAVVRSALNQHQVSLSDVGYINLVMHLEIALMRIEQGNVDAERIDINVDSKDPIWECALEIGRSLSTQLGITIPDHEIMNIYIHLCSQKKLSFSENQASVPVNEGLEQLLHVVLEEIFVIYKIDYRFDTLLHHGLLVHLESAIHRIRFGFKIHNDLLEEIEKNYSFDMQLAKILAHYIEKEHQVQLNKDEVGFLALHFTGAYERAREHDQTRVRTMIVCTTGIGTAMLLKAKLSTVFKGKLEIIRVCSYMEYQKNQYDDVDLIISTINIPSHLKIPVVVTSAIVNQNDIESIKGALQVAENQRVLSTLFRPELFVNLKGLKSRSEVIDALAAVAQNGGFIDESCIDSIRERETMGSTEIGNKVAIPHNIEGAVIRSCVVVGILDVPILWEYEKIQLVFMILLDNQTKKDAPNVFELVYHMIDLPQKVEKILNDGSFHYIEKLLKENL